MLNIEIISCLKDNYSYLIHDQDTNTVAIIDPSDFDQCDQIIKKSNLEVKNFFSKLGIFLIG